MLKIKKMIGLLITFTLVFSIVSCDNLITTQNNTTIDLTSSTTSFYSSGNSMIKIVVFLHQLPMSFMG